MPGELGTGLYLEGGWGGFPRVLFTRGPVVLGDPCILRWLCLLRTHV